MTNLPLPDRRIAVDTEHQQALSGVPDPKLRKMLNEVIESTRRTERNFQQIERTAATGKALRGRRGTESLEHEEGGFYETKEVEHGLNAVPTAVHVTSSDRVVNVSAFAFTKTKFNLGGYDSTGFHPAITVSWTALY
jgi:hypothetical protein